MHISPTISRLTAPLRQTSGPGAQTPMHPATLGHTDTVRFGTTSAPVETAPPGQFFEAYFKKNADKTDLNFNSTTPLSPEDWEAFRALAPGLKRLNIETQKTFDWTALSAANTLKTLKINSFCTTPVEGKTFLPFLSPSVTRLYLGHSGINDADLAQIATQLPNLDTLDLRAAGRRTGDITPASLPTLATLKSLRHLNLALTGLTRESIWPVVPQWPYLQTLKAWGDQDLLDPQHPLIATLGALPESVPLHAYPADKLASLPPATSPTTIRLVKTPRGTDNPRLLALPYLNGADLAHLQKLPGLQTVSLKELNLTDFHVEHLPALSNLTSLELDGNTDLTGARLHRLAGTPNLRSLSLKGTLVTDQALQKGLPETLPRVTSLELANCPKIQTLDFLSRFPNLAHLELNNTAITDDALQALSHLPNLESLNLDGTAISPAGLEHVARLAPKLEILTLRNMPKMSDAGLQPLLGLKNLKRLFLEGCNITGQSKDTLTQLTPQMTYLGLKNTPAYAAPDLQRLIYMNNRVII